MELSEFLLARIAEDEAVARAATAGPWEFAETSDGWDGKTLALETVAKLPPYSDGSVGAVGDVLSGWGYDASGISVSDEDAAQIVRFASPNRVVAECDAKRRIVELHPLVPAANIWGDSTGGLACSVCDEEADLTNGGYAYERTDGCATLRLLALPYADHPDYDPAWTPEGVNA